MSQTNQSDAMIARMERELEERNAFIQGAIGAAEEAGRDLTDNETELVKGAQTRVDAIRSQLDTLYSSRTATMEARQRAANVQSELMRMRQEVDRGAVEYRSAGAYFTDLYNSSLGDREAGDRIESYHRAAAHQKTGDNLGLIPAPIVGEVLNFIDASRPLVSFLGARPMPSATWQRPKVTQHTVVGAQGAAGGAADEKTELSSQKMLITKITSNAVTYGGYVNVSRQNIDFSSPAVMDAIIGDLAAQYAIQTEGALGAALNATATTQTLGTVGAAPTVDQLVAGLWAGVGKLYTATKGLGRVALAVSPAKIAAWGASFAPYNPNNAQGTGFSASGAFGQGVMGTISGIPVIMSNGIPGSEGGDDFGILLSSAAVEVYEQRVGTLSAVEPSVLGVQVAYAGYFTPMTVETTGVVKLVRPGA